MSPMSRSTPVALLLALLALVGCPRTDVMHLETQPREAHSLEEVDVLLEPPAEPYRAIAIVTTEDQGWRMDWDRLRDELRKEAAKIGGDAVILGEMDEDDRFVAVGTQVFSGRHRVLTGQVIVYETDSRR